MATSPWKHGDHLVPKPEGLRLSAKTFSILCSSCVCSNTGVFPMLAKASACRARAFYKFDAKAAMTENASFDNPKNLLRLPAVLRRFPVSRSKFLQGVKDGIYPKPIKITPRCVAWRDSDISELIESF